MSVDGIVDAGVLAACDPGQGGVALFPIGGTDYVIGTGLRFTIDTFDVGGSNVSYVVASHASIDTSVQELDTFFVLAQHLIDSVRF